MYKSILVPTDGSEFSGAAIEEAAKLAKELGSQLVLFYAAPHYRLSPLSEGVSAPGRADERKVAIQERQTEPETILA